MWCVVLTVLLIKTAEMATFTGFGVQQAKGPITSFQFTPPSLQAMDVEVAVDYCGLCHSDLHSYHGGEFRKAQHVV